MVEGLLAVIFVTFVLLFSIYVVRLLTAKILMDHAAARVARARTVGLNDFMCMKSAEIATIPIAGRSLLPATKLSDATELARLPLYMASENWPRARAILDYEWWRTLTMDIDEGAGLAPSIDVDMRISNGSFTVGGAASIESHYPLYMNEF